MATPSVVVISPELADAALSCGELARALKLAEWVGRGRTLTTTGVLRPVDAVQACRELDIDLAGARLRSALDVDELMDDWVVAIAAGFLDVDGRRARTTELSEAISSSHVDPQAVVHAWVRAATAVLDLGGEVCVGCLTMLYQLYAAEGPVPVDQLVGTVGDVLETLDPAADPSPAGGESHDHADLLPFDDFLVDNYVDDEVYDDEEDASEHAAGTVLGLLAFEAVETVDEAVRLTPLGVVLAESVFQAQAPSPDVDAADLVYAIDVLPPPVASTLAQPWLGARTATEAAHELLEFAEDADGGARAAALALASDLSADAVDVMRDWAKRPGIGAYARQWLSWQGEQDARIERDQADDAWLAVDAVGMMLDALAEVVPSALLPDMVAQRFGKESTESAERMLRSGHPRADEVVACLTSSPSGRRTGRSTGHLALVATPDSTSRPLVYQLKIALLGVSKPPVWRRVLVRADVTLRDLHGIIQLAMGWEDCHMHVFSTGWQEYGSPNPDLGYADDRNVHLSRVLAKPGDRLRYTCDFGDDWQHDIVLEEARSCCRTSPIPPAPQARACARPRTVAARGATPPSRTSWPTPRTRTMRTCWDGWSSMRGRISIPRNSR